MQVYIYRSEKREGLYVYVADKDILSRLPEAVQQQLGNAEFSLQMDLTAERKLSQEDAATVLDNISKNGFHLQMPRDIESQLMSAADAATRDSRDRQDRENN